MSYQFSIFDCEIPKTPICKKNDPVIIKNKETQEDNTDINTDDLKEIVHDIMIDALSDYVLFDVSMRRIDSFMRRKTYISSSKGIEEIPKNFEDLIEIEKSLLGSGFIIKEKSFLKKEYDKNSLWLEYYKVINLLGFIRVFAAYDNENVIRYTVQWETLHSSNRTIYDSKNVKDLKKAIKLILEEIKEVCSEYRKELYAVSSYYEENYGEKAIWTEDRVKEFIKAGSYVKTETLLLYPQLGDIMSIKQEETLTNIKNRLKSENKIITRIATHHVYRTVGIEYTDNKEEITNVIYIRPSGCTYDMTNYHVYTDLYGCVIEKNDDRYNYIHEQQRKYLERLTEGFKNSCERIFKHPGNSSLIIEYRENNIHKTRIIPWDVLTNPHCIEEYLNSMPLKNIEKEYILYEKDDIFSRAKNSNGKEISFYEDAEGQISLL